MGLTDFQGRVNKNEVAEGDKYPPQEFREQ
jgi:hypothetical protein